ncbi:MCE family protein [Catenovulum sp. SM1970]|uniref:PqiB family protein n=1 Tax=Marinifaba aquimaris TaxID=2741323 RepID=UPI001574362B|nr:MlaD family protein [Marinifaba aquimaris]NTS75490.1 MCE family protein [Marinifaba aquimaris]
MTQNDNTTAAVVHKKSAFSAIWLLPVIAAIIGLWLVAQSILSAGVNVVIRLDSSDGIVAGKTEVRYRGLPIGVINAININKEEDKIEAEVELIKDVEPFLNETAIFWLVKPQVGFSGVSGLDTVLTGRYFELRIGATEGNKKRVFDAVLEEPPLASDTPGLHIVLTAETQGSVGRGSQIYYKQVAVGYVYDTKLAKDSSHIEIKALIQPEHAHLVRSTSRFWNASGVEISGSISAFKVRTQSLASIISGGIAFVTPDNEPSEPVSAGFQYKLYEDYDAAKAGVIVKMHFPKNSKIQVESTKVMYENIEVGFVKSIDYDETTDSLHGDVYFLPGMAKHLREDLVFWMVSPSIGASGINNLETILQGPYITFRLGDGKAPIAYGYEVLPTAPPLDFSEPGLHLKLISRNVDSIFPGANIYYKQLAVGTVQSTKLLGDNESFEVHVHIQPQYEFLVNDSSVFYQLGGVEFSGNLQSFNVRTAPFAAMISGGIAFQTIDFDIGKTLADGHMTSLFDNFQQAVNSAEIMLTMPAHMKPLISGHTRIKYQGIDIGLVMQQTLIANEEQIAVQVNFRPEFRDLFKDGTQIWLVEAELSAGEVDVDALIGGAYLELQPGFGERKDEFELSLTPAKKEHLASGLQIQFKVDDSGSISNGSDITYRKLKIGEVDLVKMTDDGSQVDIYATIFDSYRHLVTKGAHFYNASGIEVQGSLSGIKINTASVASILEGGIALLATDEMDSNPADEGEVFELFPTELAAEMGGVNLAITWQQVVDIKVGAPVVFNNHKVGEVTKVRLSEDLATTKVELFVAKKYQSLYRSDSQFWLEQARVSVAEFRNPMALISGNYVSVRAGSEQANTAYTFIASTYEPALKTLKTGLNLTLSTDFAGSVKAGDPVYYRQVEVGDVLGVDLNGSGNGVSIFINLKSRYVNLVNDQTKFWNASGIEVDAGLFSGVKIDTQSLETIVSGGIAFATPEDKKAEKAQQGQRFKLHDSVDHDWLEWKPNLPLN